MNLTLNPSCKLRPHLKFSAILCRCLKYNGCRKMCTGSFTLKMTEKYDFGVFYPLKDMTDNIKNDQLDELYIPTKTVFYSWHRPKVCIGYWNQPFRSPLCPLYGFLTPNRI